MKALTLSLIVILSAATSLGCDRKSMAKKQSQNIEEAMALAQDLNDTHSIDVIQEDAYISVEAKNTMLARAAWQLHSAESRSKIDAKLAAFINKVNRILSMYETQGVKGNANAIEQWLIYRRNAQTYLDSLRKFES